MRKLVIGLIVLGALLALYAGYARLGGTPPPGLGAPEPMPAPVANAAGEPNARGGKVGDTQVIEVGQTRFFHRTADGGRDREFGFETILHKQGDRWRFTNPYMKLFLPNVRCEVTADAGEVQVQTAFGQLVPNDALFEGNVVIHVIPPKRNDPRECFIYLDDVTFVAERSLFSSTGPVRFVSHSAVLDGVGMELIYDSLESRLELFHIIKLTTLRMRSADLGLFSGDKDAARPKPRGAGEPAAVAAPAGPAIASNAPPAGAGHVFYECVLRRDVKIDTPERVVAARDFLSITSIPWARSEEGGQTGRGIAGGPSEPNASAEPAAPPPEPLDMKVSRQLAFDAMPAEQFDIVVTCSGGLLVAPEGASGRYADPNEAARTRSSGGGVFPQIDPQSSRQQVIARCIQYNAETGDAALAGPVQMAALLDPNGLAAPAQAQADRRRAGGAPMPMTITAKDAVRFLSARSQVVFEGDCTVLADRTEPDVTHSFSLAAPKFVLDLVKDANAPSAEKVAGKAVGLKRFSTDGGRGSIVVRRRAGRLHPAGEGKLLGWTRVLASRLEYDAADKLFTARGPGELQLNNAAASSLDPNVGELRAARTPARDVRDKARQVDPNAFGFGQPCYAFLRDFDLLTFASETSRIVVSAESRPILIDYLPIIDGTYGQHIKGDAGHIDLTLRQTAAGRMELASLIASKGVTYEDQARQFAGGILTYDREKSLVKVVGDETQPCYFNGALVDRIEMDTATGTLKTRLQAPSVFQGKR